MEAAASLLDRLYTTYILRDFVAKVLPGLVTVVAFAFDPLHPNIALRHLAALPPWAWPFLLGLAFIAGFALQAFGEGLGITRIYPDGPTSDPNARTAGIVRMSWVFESKRPWASQQRERFVVIKEMMANFSLSILLFAAMALISYTVPTIGPIVRLALALIFLINMIRYSHIMADDQRTLEQLAYSLPKKDA